MMVSGNDNTRTIASGFLWKILESGGDQLVTFLVSLVLARLLGPDRYGTMTVMLIAVAVANVIIQSGFQTALIQKKEVDELDYSSVFLTGLGLSAFLYAVIFLLSPAIAGFFRDPEITAMLRVLSLILFPGSVVSVGIARVSRQMNFRLQCISTILSDIISGVIGIILAFRGAGTWSLVFQQLLRNILLMIFLMLLLRWLPKAGFSLRRLGVLFSYGWKVLVSGLIDTIYTNLYTPVISRICDSTMVGLYGRANQFPQVLANAMSQSVQSVMLPAFSKLQEERDRTRELMRRTLRISSLIMFPVMFGLMAVAGPFIRVLLGEAWTGAAELLVLCCLSFSVWHIHVINLQAINAAGRSDMTLKLEIIKKLAGVLVLLCSIPLGIRAMLLLKGIFDYVCTFINGAPNRRINGYGPLRQWRDILPEFLMAGAMGAAVFFICEGLFRLGLSAFPVLLTGIAAGALLYAGELLLFKPESFSMLLEFAVLRKQKKQSGN